MSLETSIGFLIHIVALVIVYYFSWRWRNIIIDFVERIPIPRFARYVLCSLPFIVFEEFINCIECFPNTIFWLSAYVIILGLIVRRSAPESFLQILIIFSIIGTIWEVLYGGAKGIPALPPLFALFMLIWTAVSYSFLVAIPLKILLKK